jgi:hypothetical protein
MSKLGREDLNHIRAWLKAGGIYYKDQLEELTDHMASKVEATMEEAHLDFMRAFEIVSASTPLFRLKIARGTALSNQNFRRFLVQAGQSFLDWRFYLALLLWLALGSVSLDWLTENRQWTVDAGILAVLPSLVIILVVAFSIRVRRSWYFPYMNALSLMYLSLLFLAMGIKWFNLGVGVSEKGLLFQFALYGYVLWAWLQVARLRRKEAAEFYHLVKGLYT